MFLVIGNYKIYCFGLAIAKTNKQGDESQSNTHRSVDRSLFLLCYARVGTCARLFLYRNAHAFMKLLIFSMHAASNLTVLSDRSKLPRRNSGPSFTPSQ